MELKEGNYITIQSFMSKELELKGNELLIYAIIYGFSQTENQYYTGSRQYLATWCNSTRYGVDKALKKLLDKGLIEKDEEYKNNIKYCKYRITQPEYQATELTGVSTKLIGGVNKVDRGYQQSCPNNIEDNIEDNIDTITKVIEQKAPKQFGNVEINELFNEWEKQCGFKIDSKVKQNRYACQRLIKSKGLDKTLKVLEIVSEAQKDKYAPGIYNFIDLAEKWNNLAVWYQKKIIMKKKTGVLIV